MYLAPKQQRREMQQYSLASCSPNWMPMMIPLLWAVDRIVLAQPPEEQHDGAAQKSHSLPAFVAAISIRPISVNCTACGGSEGCVVASLSSVRAYFLLITADFGHNFHIIAERTRAQKVAERA